MAGSKWCTACGAENSATAGFCKACGKPMGGNAPQGTPQENAPKTDGFQAQNRSQQSYGFQGQGSSQFQTKPQLKPQNSAGLGFSAYISIVAIVIGVVLFFFGQQQLDSYAGLTWYYTDEAAMGNALRAFGGFCCILGVIGLIRYFIMKK